jgi:hypothetical protein
VPLGFGLLMSAVSGGWGPAAAMATVASRTTVALNWVSEPVGQIADARGSSLDAISCATATDCYAVGSSYDGALALGGTNGSDPQQHPLIAHYNGAVWRFVAAPKLSGALSGIDCVSEERCVAVGGQPHGVEGSSTLIEQFNGTSWSVVASPNQIPPASTALNTSTGDLITSNWLSAVSCANASNCLAVGGTSSLPTNERQAQDFPLSETYEGSEWQVAPVSNSWSGSLTSDSCVDSSCFSVGLVEGIPLPPQKASGQFTGLYVPHSWRRLDAPEASGTGVAGVACLSIRECFGVGGDQENQPYAAVLSRESWRTVPVTPTTANASLWGLACLHSRCVAVGSAGFHISSSSPRSRALVVTLDARRGAAQIVTLHNARNDILLSVACPSPKRCFAVGYSQKVAPFGAARLLVVSGSP